MSTSVFSANQETVCVATLTQRTALDFIRILAAGVDGFPGDNVVIERQCVAELLQHALLEAA